MFFLILTHKKYRAILLSEVALKYKLLPIGVYMYIKRDYYLQRLASKKDNGLVKIITGVRRCGKSFLLFTLYKNYLLQSGISSDCIVTLALDNALNAKYRDPIALSDYIQAQTNDPKKRYYVFLDEIQFVGIKKLQSNPDIYVTFYDVLNGLTEKGNLDVYVTGSNSKMLSQDIVTEFRGRGDELHISPLSLQEYYDYVGGSKEQAFADYMLYGGMPLVLSKQGDAEKRAYLSALFSETYFKDISERNSIAFPDVLQMLTDELCSGIGSYTNSSKIANTLQSVRNVKIDSETISSYIKYLTDAYLFSVARRYDVKGKKYFSYPSKYYCTDPGLRNACLNFRQVEETHLMENIIYNELICRGYSVDVGVVSGSEKISGKQTYVMREIDFVVNAGKPGEKFYLQSALQIDSDEKREQELRPFLKLKNDFTKRIIITKTMMKPWTDDYGIHHIGIYDFLLNRNSLNM